MSIIAQSKFQGVNRITKAIKANVGKDVVFTLITNLWRIISGPVTMVFIPLFLTPQVQGFWYTFVSLAALSVFADLGFTTIVSQFSAHEYAYLSFNNEAGILQGSELHIKRLGSLLRFVIKWALAVSVVGFPVILLVGFYMFRENAYHVNWIFPWCIYVLSSGLTFTAGVVLSFLEGCNQIAAIQKNRFLSTVTITVLTLTFLYFGFNLYALAVTAVIGALVNIGLLYLRFRRLIKQVVLESRGYIVDWKSEFFKLLWRYAISWGSGYLIFQIYTPLMFRFHGAVEAGKVGISMTLASATFAIANVWVYVATPKMNMFASRRDWAGMDKLLLKSLGLALCTFLLGSSIILSAIAFYADSITFLKRFLGLIPMAMLLCAWLFQMIINALAVYLRAHKKEPFVLISVVKAVYIGVSTVLIIKFMPPQYLFLGFFTAVMWVLPWSVRLFIRKKKEWHI